MTRFVCTTLLISTEQTALCTACTFSTITKQVLPSTPKYVSSSSDQGVGLKVTKSRSLLESKQHVWWNDCGVLLNLLTKGIFKKSAGFPFIKKALHIFAMVTRTFVINRTREWVAFHTTTTFIICRNCVEHVFVERKEICLVMFLPTRCQWNTAIPSWLVDDIKDTDSPILTFIPFWENL